MYKYIKIENSQSIGGAAGITQFCKMQYIFKMAF